MLPNFAKKKNERSGKSCFTSRVKFNTIFCAKDGSDCKKRCEAGSFCLSAEEAIALLEHAPNRFSDFSALSALREKCH
jgi:hypothetical protein